MSAPRHFALVPAAGHGSRAGLPVPKQYAPLLGQALLAHTLNALRAVAEIDRVAVVLAPDDARFEAAVPGFDGWVWRCGGATRAASVAAGLTALRRAGAQDGDWVLVHDAARCLIRPDWVRTLLRQASAHAVGGLLALPVADTLKRGEHGQVTATVDRSGMWAAQTPQMFRLGLLAQALDRVGDGATDEASAIEHLGLKPLLVRCSMENFKVTLPEDFALAETLLKGRL